MSKTAMKRYGSMTRAELIAELRTRDVQSSPISDDSYRHALELAEVGLWRIDAAGKTSFANGRMAGMLGYTVAEMLGQSLFAFLDEKERQRAPVLLEQHRQETSEGHDFLFRRKDGAKLWTFLRTVSLFDEAGRYAGVLAVVIDRTAQQRAEDNLRINEQRYRQILTNLPVIIFAIDVQGIITLLEGKGLAPLGIEQGQFVGQSVFALDTLDDRTLQPIWRALIGEMSTVTVSFAGRQFGVRTEPLQDEAGRVIGMTGVAIDMTERLEATQRLAQSEQHLHFALDSSRAGAWEWHLDTNKIVWSAGNYRVLGYEPGAVPASYESWLQRVHTDDRPHAEDSVARCLANRSGLDMETRLVLPDGEVRWVRNVGRFYSDQVEKSPHLIGTQIDITDQKRTQLAVQASEKRFRTIVESSLQGIAILQDGHVVYASPTELKLRDRTAADFVGQPVETLLESVHPDDQAVVTQAWLDFAAGQSEAFAVQYRLQRRDGSYRWVFGRLVPCEYEGRLAILGMTLDIDERKKAEAQATHIMISLRDDAGLLQLTIADDGSGFDPAELRQGKPNGGWGIPNMRHRAEALGGVLRLVSSPAKGTTVIVEVPR